MKEFLIIRHAKSAWNYDGLVDHDRPLNKRGEADAPLMAKKTKLFFKPDYLLSSTAVRAQTTANCFIDEFDLADDSIQFTRRLYHASEDEILESLRNLDDEFSKVLVFGHNPGMTYFTSNINSNTSIDNLPTCGIVHVKYGLDSWADIDFDELELVSFIYPKMFK